MYRWFLPISPCNLTMVFFFCFSLRPEPRRKRNLINSNQGQDLTGFSARCLSGHMVFDSVASLGDRKRDTKNEPWKIMENTNGETTHMWCIIIYYIYIYVCVYVCVTSSTAQGGGGSFKDRKPIGEIRCCESGMAERSHWLTERWLELCWLEWLQWLQWSPHPQLLDVVWCTATVVVVVA